MYRSKTTAALLAGGLLIGGVGCSNDDEPRGRTNDPRMDNRTGGDSMRSSDRPAGMAPNDAGRTGIPGGTGNQGGAAPGSSGAGTGAAGGTGVGGSTR